MAEVKQPPAKHRKSASHDRSHETIPPAGQHAKPELTDEDKTAGSGMLPDPARKPKSTEAPSG